MAIDERGVTWLLRLLTILSIICCKYRHCTSLEALQRFIDVVLYLLIPRIVSLDYRDRPNTKRPRPKRYYRTVETEFKI